MLFVLKLMWFLSKNLCYGYSNEFENPTLVKSSNQINIHDGGRKVQKLEKDQA